MSTHPVLLGRVAGLNVGDTSDTPKREGQASPPCHVDIEASPRPTVTRVMHGDSQNRPSWTWRCLQMFIALLVVIFTTWVALDGLEVAALKDDPSFIALMVSTGIAGLAAMWLYLIAPTAHTLLAARFFVPQLGGRLGDAELCRSCKGVSISTFLIDGRLGIPSHVCEAVAGAIRDSWLAISH